jgi:cell wall-associated NlpC family hydrolase
MASKATNTRFLAIACGIAATITLIVLVLLLANPFGKGEATAKVDDSKYAVTFDGDQVYGAGQQPAAKTENAALIRDDSEAKFASPEKKGSKPHKIADMPAASVTTAPAEGAGTTAEMRKALKEQNAGGKSASGESVELDGDGSALAPLNAPPAVNAVIAAANAIKNYPYIWGGGHGSFQDNGYDCSGSVSYALAGANLLKAPMVSGAFENYGDPGPGKWITIYANAGHMFMVVGGLRFDTSFRDGPRGSRWQSAKRNMNGFEVRHPPGL